MADIPYQNLDIQIEPVDASNSQYRVRVSSPPTMGGDEDLIERPFTDENLTAFFSGLGLTRDLSKPSGTTPTLSVKDFGQRLYRAVFKGRIETFLALCQDRATTSGQRLRLRLRLDKATDLLNLPWEYLYNPEQRLYLALDDNTSLVRYVELRQGLPLLTTPPPLRVLVMISSPKDADVPQLDVEGEWANLTAALDPLKQAGQATVERLPKATLGSLRDELDRAQLEDRPYHVFHFIGHGDFDIDNQEGVLLLETDSQGQDKVNAQTLVQYLQKSKAADNSRSLRLVVLNACKGGRTSVTDPFAGMAQTLMLQNIPAVVAMQFAITDDAAKAFAAEFYKGVTKGLALDAAMTNARFAIQENARNKGRTNDREWGTPVLYMRAADGYIFDVQLPATSTPSVVPAGTSTQPGSTPTPTSPTTTAPIGGAPVPTDDQYTALPPHVRLRELLIDSFNEEDLKLLCNNLGVDYGDLEGNTRRIKVLSLIDHFKRRRRISDLINEARSFDADRAKLPWPNAADIK